MVEIIGCSTPFCLTVIWLSELIFCSANKNMVCLNEDRSNYFFEKFILMAVKFSATYLKMSTDKYKLSWLELNFIWIGSNINGNFFKLVGKQVDLNWGRPGSGLTRWINCSSCKVNEVVQLSYFLGLWSWSWEAMYPFFCSSFACLY